MPNAYDPRPENGTEILALAKQVIPTATSVEFAGWDRHWRVTADHGEVWKVIPDSRLPEGVLFEIEHRP